jgi:hypothetical protein
MPRMVKIKREVLAALAVRQGAITDTPTARAAFDPSPIEAGRLVAGAIKPPALYPPAWRAVVAGGRRRAFATTAQPAPAPVVHTASDSAVLIAARRAGDERRIAAEQAGHVSHHDRSCAPSASAAWQADRRRADTERMFAEQQGIAR